MTRTITLTVPITTAVGPLHAAVESYIGRMQVSVANLSGSPVAGIVEDNITALGQVLDQLRMIEASMPDR